MINDRDTVAMGSRAQKVKDPATSGMVNGAKSNQTKSILPLIRRVFSAIKKRGFIECLHDISMIIFAVWLALILGGVL